jgi:hypothetical protein
VLMSCCLSCVASQIETSSTTGTQASVNMANRNVQERDKEQVWTFAVMFYVLRKGKLIQDV